MKVIVNVHLNVSGPDRDDLKSELIKALPENDYMVKWTLDMYDRNLKKAFELGRKTINAGPNIDIN